ncbi:hypothetical protein BHM03_00040094 [Ensete ventricosum]|nr:hypothetical protein BHM03_00040094 [Ensete ventricosum]
MIGPATVARPPLSNRRKLRRPLLLLCFPLPQYVRSRSQPPAIPAYSGHQPPLPSVADPCLVFPCCCCPPSLNRVIVAHSSSPSCNQRLQPSSLVAAVASSRALFIFFPLPQSHLLQPPLSQRCPTVASSRNHPSPNPAACQTLLLPLPLPRRTPLLVGTRCPSLLSASLARRNTATTSSSIATSSAVAVASSRAISLYVPSHLHLMVFELVKNSLRAVQERFMDSEKDVPPVRIIVADGIEDVTIKISDEGGGIARSGLPKIFTYLYSTAKNPLDENYEGVSDGVTMAGYGYGLPISRLYARYFGGDLQIISMEGYDDLYLWHCKKGSKSTGKPVDLSELNNSFSFPKDARYVPLPDSASFIHLLLSEERRPRLLSRTRTGSQLAPGFHRRGSRSAVVRSNNVNAASNDKDPRGRSSRRQVRSPHRSCSFCRRTEGPDKILRGAVSGED